MTYWRMQLHPNEALGAVRHSVESLAAGFIGLDFEYDVGDLTLNPSNVPDHQKDYLAFGHEMARGDRVLIVAHHFPFALTVVDGDYNYIRSPVPEIGVWFRHFRRIRDTRYFADFRTNARGWDQLIMTDTISPLRDPEKMSYRLIEELGATGE